MTAKTGTLQAEFFKLMKNEVNMQQKIQDIIVDLIYENNLTISDLSRKIGMDYKQLSNFVKGKYAPSLKSAIKLADFFGCSLDFLCGLSDHFSVHEYSEPDYMFYNRYKQILSERGITHYKLAKKTGINVNDSRLWKQGKIPTLSTLIKISDYLGVSIDNLIGRSVK